MDNEMLQAIQTRLDAARAELSALCKGKRWQMTVPADRSRDSDLIIAAVLSDISVLLDELGREQRNAEMWQRRARELESLCADRL